MIGSRLGPYEITAKLGEGGMGEVYRATDSKLKREVAIKVLPAAFVEDRERLARFEREAQLLAQLNHPNIAHIYGMEASGESHALVMELVEGPTLAERLEQGALPLDESLSFARQIAEALEEAHAKGIVHRDLKPQNVKASREGKIKVLDFGLAKAMDPPGVASGAVSSSQLAASPTLTLGATVQGVILGSAAYMAPEQARGVAVDKRADIWAFGVVLFEMLTGRRLFEGDLVTDVLANVINREIDLSALPASTPASIRRLLRRCLERKPKSRLHDIADARIVIDEVLSGAVDESAAPAVPAAGSGPAWLRVLPWALLAVVGALWIATGLRRGGAPGAEAMRLPLDFGDEPLSMTYGASAVLSPEGRRMTWLSGRDRDVWINILDLETGESRRLAGTEGAHDPVFSPDGQEIAYFGAAALFKVPVSGGTPQRLAEVGLPRGVTWTEAGLLVYNRDVADGLWKVPASGGEPVRLSAPDRQERSHRWPRAVPGTSKVLFLAQQLGQKYEEATIELLDLESGERTVVHRGGSYPRLSPNGLLLFARDQALWAAPFDVRSGSLTRAPVRVVPEIAYSDWSGGSQFDVDARGDLVFSTGRSDAAVDLTWFDPATGGSERVAGESGFYYTPALSPDGQTLALQIYSVGRSDVWLLDLRTGGRRRLTFGGREEYPVWSPDGERIAFSRIPEGSGRSLALMRADGSGEPVALAPGATQCYPTSWSNHGELLFVDFSPETHADLWIAWPDAPERAPEPFLATPAEERRAVFSPDGRWVAYESDESGQNEVYVRPFPGPGGQWQISEDGGSAPRWSNGGESLYYWGREGLVRRAVNGQGSALVPGKLEIFRIAQPTLRTEDAGYVVAADGRVLILAFANQQLERARTTLVLGWEREVLDRLTER